MADDVKLLAVVDANTKAFENALKRIERSTNQTFGKADQSVRRLEKTLATTSSRLASVGQNFSSAFLRPLIALVSAQALGAAVNAFQKIENALKVAGLQGEAAAKVFDHLTETAQRNGAPVEALAQLYSRLAIVQKSLGVSSGEILGFLDGVAAALRVSGRSAEESRGALLQLSQAMGSGIVRAEEFNAILEGALPVAQAAARGLKEAGGEVAKLRVLVINGKVSSEAFFKAFQAGQGALQSLAGTTELTLGQALENLRTRMIAAIGKLDDATGGASRLQGAMNSLGTAMEFVITQLARIAQSDAGAAIGNIVDKIAIGVDKLGRLTGGFVTGKFKGEPGHEFVRHILDTDDAILQAEDKLREDLQKLKDNPVVIDDLIAGPSSNTEKSVAQTEAIAKRLDAAFEVIGEGKPKPVSLEDFPPPLPTVPGLGGNQRSAAISDIDRQKEAVRDLISELQREASLVGASDTQQRISNELHQAGAVATTKQRDAIIALVTQIESQKEAEESLIDTLDGVRFAAGSALDAFSQSIQNSEGAAAGLKAALVDVLQTIIRIGEQQSITSLFGGQGQTGGGLFGSIIGGLFGATTGGGGPTLGSLTAASASVTGGGRGAPVIQLNVVPGQMFEPVVKRISGNVSIRHAASAETRAVARTPASARDNQRRFAIP